MVLVCACPAARRPRAGAPSAAYHAAGVGRHAALQRLDLARRELILLHAVAQAPVPPISCPKTARALCLACMLGVRRRDAR